MSEMRRLSIGFAGLLVVCAGCRTPGPAATRQASADNGVEVLASWLTGSFSSAAQAERDPDHYFDIRLHMVPIWSGRADGPWLYVEQAAATSPERPYRQRVYHLVARPGGEVASEIYTLPGNPLSYAGGWTNPGRFDALSPDDLELREGCTMVLKRREDGAFAGGTTGTDCESRLHGATYATSEAVVTRDKLVSWDRGYDTDGQQVWGATEGGYVFIKQTE